MRSISSDFVHYQQAVCRSVLMSAATVMLSIVPVSAASLYDQAVKSFNAKNYQEAHRTLGILLKSKPSDVNALYYNALCCCQLKNYEEATANYRRIVQIAPDSGAGKLAKQALSSLGPAAISSSATSAQSPSAGSLASSSLTAVSTLAGASSFVPAASTGGSNRATSGTGRESVATPPPATNDLASLPDHANFYFTKESGGHMAVDVNVNGHQLPAIFDTGAGALFYKDQLLAAGVDCNKLKSAGYARGWAGISVPNYIMEAEVKLGTFSRKIPICVIDTASGFQRNLVGQTLISGYQYEIDDKGGRVELRKTIEKGEQRFDPLYDIPLKVVQERDIIEVEVNGRRIKTFIDTGASSTIINQATAEECGVEITGSQRMSGVGGSLAVGLATARVRLGPISKDFLLHIGGSCGNCIGQDFMEGWRFKIDREHGFLRLFH